jgi:hypothetical protein
MGRFLLILLLVCAIPWSVRTWWQMRRARGPRERALIGRMSFAAWAYVALAIIGLNFLPSPQAKIFALPILAATGLALQHGYRKARARIQSEEADPLSRARRIN